MIGKIKVNVLEFGRLPDEIDVLEEHIVFYLWIVNIETVLRN